MIFHLRIWNSKQNIGLPKYNQLLRSGKDLTPTPDMTYLFCLPLEKTEKHNTKKEAVDIFWSNQSLLFFLQWPRDSFQPRICRRISHKNSQKECILKVSPYPIQALYHRKQMAFSSLSLRIDPSFLFNMYLCFYKYLRQAIIYTTHKILKFNSMNFYKMCI